MPAFNKARFIGETVQMVLDQTFTDFELIIYNDGSSDNTAELVRGFTDPRITFIDRPNLGPPHPLNAILAQASGEYIIIMHDHDIFHPELLEKSVKALDEYPQAGLVLQGNATVNEDGQTGFKSQLLDLPPHNDGMAFAKQWLLQPTRTDSQFHACCMVRRSAYEAVGMYYDPAFGWYADLDLWLRLLPRFGFVYLNEILYTFRTREANHALSNNFWLNYHWVFGIYEANIKRIFASDPAQLRQALGYLQAKREKSQIQGIMYSAAKKQKPIFEEGLAIVATQHQNWLFRSAARTLNISGWGKYIVLLFANRLYNLTSK
jgi:glycosyltransferase involved in cell wall biosynthesis